MSWLSGKMTTIKTMTWAFTTLLWTARRCNIKLNYDKLKFKCTEVNFYWQKPTLLMGTNQHEARLQPIVENASSQLQKRGAVFHRNNQLLNKIFAKAYQVI